MVRVLILGIVGLTTWESREKCHLGEAPMVNHKKIIKGKVVASPKSEPRESCESMYACGSLMHQKCFNYTLTNLLFGMCTSI